MLVCSKICHYKANFLLVLLDDAAKETERANLCRQLDGLKLEKSYLDGFLSHLQNEVKERLIEEEANLHIYSSNDVDMLVPHIRFTCVHGCHGSTFVCYVTVKEIHNVEVTIAGS
jgi:hypothetical protein